MSNVSERFHASHPGYAARHNAAYYLSHAAVLKARAKARYHATKGLFAARYLKNRAAILARFRERRELNDDVRDQARACYARNPAAAIARANKRRALKVLAAVGTDRSAYRAFVKAVRCADVIVCRWCERPVPRSQRRIDHVVPLSRGGADAVENLCCACHQCNARKADKLLSEWKRGTA